MRQDPPILDFALPLAVDEVDAAWLSRAFGRSHPGIMVSEAHVTEVMPGASTKIWMTIAYDPAGEQAGLPQSIVLKGGFEAHSRSMAYMHENEARYYDEIQPLTEINTPLCLFAGTDRQAGQSIVVLEDLRPLSPIFCHATRPLDYGQCAAFLDGIARYQAQWWNSPDLEDGGRFDWILPQLRHLSQGGYRSRVLQPELWTKEVWDKFLALPRCAAIPRALHDHGRLQQALLALGERQAAMPVTLCHGDTHLGNLYIEKDGRPGFLDAQMRRAPWPMDVAYHIVAALDIEDRRRWERSLLNHYLSALRRHGVADAPGFEEAWLSYRCEILYGLFVWSLNANEFQSETVNTAVNARFGAAATDHGSLTLLLG